MRVVVAALTLAALAVIAPAAAAQTTLAWKLKAGEKFDLHVEQQTNSTVTVLAKTVKSTMEMTLDSTWSVESASDGVAKIKQTVGRVQVKLQAADAAPVSYDTAGAGQPSGAARDLAAAVKPLVDPESSIILTMNQRGEVLTVELSPKLAESWRVADQDGAEKKGPTKESLDALLKQSLVILPDKPVSEGSKWETARELATPTGKFTQKIDYTFQGRKESPGGTADAIACTATLSPVQQGKTKIKEQLQTGMVYFDGETGRFVSGEQKQKLVTETPYRDATITVVVESQVKRRMTPK